MPECRERFASSKKSQLRLRTRPQSQGHFYYKDFRAGEQPRSPRANDGYGREQSLIGDRFPTPRSIWLLLPAAASLSVFAYLLTLHPTAAGRVYAAYGGVYIAVAIGWLWAVDKVQPTVTDWVGASVCLLGMAIIMLGARSSS